MADVSKFSMSGLTLNIKDATARADLANKADVATTLAGYGITDAYTQTEVDTLLSAKADSATSLSGYGITDAYTQTEIDTLLDAKADQTVIGDEYNSATSYAAGDYFTYSGIRYKVNVACVGVTPPNANYYTVTPIDDDMADLSSQISNLAASLDASINSIVSSNSATSINKTVSTSHAYLWYSYGGGSVTSSSSAFGLCLFNHVYTIQSGADVSASVSGGILTLTTTSASVLKGIVQIG